MSEVEKLKNKYPYLDLYDYPVQINNKGKIFQIGDEDTRKQYTFRRLLAFNIYQHPSQGQIIRAVYGSGIYDTFITFDDINTL